MSDPAWTVTESLSLPLLKERNQVTHRRLEREGPALLGLYGRCLTSNETSTLERDGDFSYCLRKGPFHWTHNSQDLLNNRGMLLRI